MAGLGRTMAAVAVVVAAVAAQDGMDDLQDMDSMLAPPGQEGGEAQAARPRVTELTMIQQTTLALQQLGIVIGQSGMAISPVCYLTSLLPMKADPLHLKWPFHT